ncbi:hypothetical protein Trydic_g22911 [Trypoxylus dichotomus]
MQDTNAQEKQQYAEHSTKNGMNLKKCRKLEEAIKIQNSNYINRGEGLQYLKSILHAQMDSNAHASIKRKETGPYINQGLQQTCHFTSEDFNKMIETYHMCYSLHHLKVKILWNIAFLY